MLSEVLLLLFCSKKNLLPPFGYKKYLLYFGFHWYIVQNSLNWPINLITFVSVNWPRTSTISGGARLIFEGLIRDQRKNWGSCIYLNNFGTICLLNISGRSHIGRRGGGGLSPRMLTTWDLQGNKQFVCNVMFKIKSN